MDRLYAIPVVGTLGLALTSGCALTGETTITEFDDDPQTSDLDWELVRVDYTDGRSVTYPYEGYYEFYYGYYSWSLSIALSLRPVGDAFDAIYRTNRNNTRRWGTETYSYDWSYALLGRGWFLGDRTYEVIIPDSRLDMRCVEEETTLTCAPGSSIEAMVFQAVL